MPNTNRRTVMRTALATLAGALPAASSLAGRPTPEAKPFVIPPRPAPPGASQELLNAISARYEMELQSFGLELDYAQAMYRNYPELVMSEFFPQACVDALVSANGCGPEFYIDDDFMRPEKIVQEAENLVQSIRADAEARAERRTEEEEKRKAAEAQAERERRERINALTPAQRAEQKVRMLAELRKSVHLLVKTYDEEAVELRETHGIDSPACIPLPRLTARAE